MLQKLLTDLTYYELQFRIDADLAEQVHAAGCTACGGRLDRAPYPRKPRGAMVELPDAYRFRFSFCCAADGCRRRCTPPSLRFLGRRVYLGAVVILATAMRQGVTPVRARRLRELLGVSLQTLARWREWWKAAFVESAFWKAARAFFSPAVDERTLPTALLERFGGQDGDRLIALLRFLGPLSTTAGYIPDQRH